MKWPKILSSFWIWFGNTLCLIIIYSLVIVSVVGEKVKKGMWEKKEEK